MKVLVDTHAHLYPMYDPALYLETAWNTLERTAAGSGKVLILTERATERYFERAAASGTLGLHPAIPTKELTSLKLILSGERVIHLITGRQFVSAEGLEILSLCGCPALRDRLGARELLHSINESGAIAVIPWSFGKWLGRRGRALRSMIEDPSLSFFLGDIYGRSAGLGRGNVFFRAAHSAHRPILYGSDTLPLSGEERHAAALVTSVTGDFDPDLPSLSIKAMLSAMPESAGTYASPACGLARQVKLRLGF